MKREESFRHNRPHIERSPGLWELAQEELATHGGGHEQKMKEKK